MPVCLKCALYPRLVYNHCLKRTLYPGIQSRPVYLKRVILYYAVVEHTVTKGNAVAMMIMEITITVVLLITMSSHPLITSILLLPLTLKEPSLRTGYSIQ